jgi:N-acetyl sugar amidotransferase
MTKAPLRVCARCLYTELHPLNIVINDDGLCSGCRIHEEKDQIDWPQRQQQLAQLLNAYRSRSGQHYDCIVPVSGGRDSYFIVDYIKQVMGMNPLLVTYNPHYNTALGLRNLAYLRSHSDCDLFTMTVSPHKVKNITRATLRRIGSICWHVIAGQTVFPVQVAVRLKIPLIIWGCHQGIDQVGMFSHHHFVEMTRKYRHEHDLMGLEAEDLLSDDDQVFERDIYPFLYPDNQQIAHVGVRGIYLNNYVRWDSKAQHEAMIAKYGFETSPQPRTFDTYNDGDSFIYSDLHDAIKVLKWGYGKVVDHACREIRLGRLTREQAQDKVIKHSQPSPQHQQLFLDWLGMQQSALDFILDQHRHPDIWQRDQNWQWQRVDRYESLSEHRVEKHRLLVNGDCEFIHANSRVANKDDAKPPLFIKGFVG